MLNQLSLKSNIELIKNADAATIKREHLPTLFRLHYDLFGETCQSCPAKIAGYIRKIKNYDQNTIIMKSTNFTLKEGVLLHLPGTKKPLTNHNLTDENAEAILKANPNRIALFSKFPDSYKGASKSKPAAKAADKPAAKTQATKTSAAKPDASKQSTTADTGKAAPTTTASNANAGKSE